MPCCARRQAARGACAPELLFSAGVDAQSTGDPNFTVRDLRVEGLQRISEGTVYNYLPVNIGDRLDSVRLREAFRALYAQKFFDEIEFRRDGDTLVVVVRERPSIASFDITGNKDIKTEDLLQSLRDVGLSPGRSFDRSVLDNVTQFLTQQYFERGKYGVQVDASVTDLPDNRVSIQVIVEEGSRARIRQINVVGNTSYRDSELLDQFQLSTPTLLSFLNKKDRYAREALEGDLEALRSYYMDRGFAAFDIESTQVAISPGKQDIYITVNIKEGERYTISDVRLTGDLVLP
ncbi:MAG: POTRA domain-containing protein, partial [Pseudomonadota bacterium]